MNKRHVPIIAFTLAVLFVSSIAYASDKRKKARQSVQDPSELSEEALKVELLSVTEAQHDKLPVTVSVSSNKNADADTAKGKEKK